MYEACNTLSGIPTRIVCLVILLSLSLPSNATNVASQMSLSRERKITRDVPYKEAASWKRMTRSESKVNVQRLYDAYRQRFRKESDESEEEDIGGDMKELLTNEKVEDINDKADIKSQLHLNSPTTINTDEEEDSDNKENIETDLQSTQKETQLNSSPGTKADDLKSIKKENQVPLAGTSTESKVKAVEVKKKPEIQSPAVSGMVIMKLDGHPHVGIASTKALPAQAGFEQQLDETDRQIAELNRIYHEMMNSFQKTLPNSTGKSSMTKPVHLSAFTQLINIFKRLAHTDLVGEIAKKINDEMELEAQPILENTQDVSLVATNNSPMSLNQMGQWEIKDTDDINKLFDRMDPRRASSVFKRVANEMKVVRPLIKSGGLYDEYKKRLSKILKEQKYPRQSVTSDPIESESSQKLIKKATETQLREGREKPNKSSAKHNNYLKALETYIQTNRESQLNGGIKPYYLPNSKNRQLVWNEVPLLKPKNGDSPKKSSQKSEALGLKEDHKKPTTYNLYPGIEPQQIDSGVKALKHSSFFSLLDEYEKQINDINRALQAKQRWWKDALPKDDPNRGNAQGFLPSKGGQLTSCLRESPERAFVSSNTFPGVLLDLPAGMSSPQPIGGNVIDNLASQMKLSPLELAQRIATAANSATGQNMQGMGMVMASTPPPPQAATVASQINVNQMVNATKAITENQVQAPNLAPILDKILQRLETMKDMKLNRDEESNANPLPCCFAEPSDGTPCDLNGSWESLLLGIRINIRGSSGKGNGEDEVAKPTCAQPKRKPSASLSSLNRRWRQCVKINSTQIKALTPGLAPTIQWLNITIQETTPPKQHELIDNVAEWTFSGYTLNILGGPISLSCRRTGSNLIGTFVGYCRTCGCVDTVFGSWTFCQPSRDCQDITTSIFDRRDMLRRYSMEDKRTNRFKEQLYLRSKFAKVEKNRQQAKQIAFDKVQAFPPPQNEYLNSQPGPVQDPHQTRPIFQSLY